MPTPLNEKIRTVRDRGFQQLVTELCLCAGFERDAIIESTLYVLLQEIVTSRRGALSLQTINDESILAAKVGDFVPGSVTYQVLEELAAFEKLPLDSFSRRALFSLIKECVPKRAPVKRPTKFKRMRQREISTATERRAAGLKPEVR